VTTWLYRIVSNRVASRVRRAQVRRALSAMWGGLTGEDLAEPRAPDAGLENAEASVVMERVLARMSPRKREVFMLYELEELPGETIAEMVGCSVATVWSRLFYARKEFEQLARAELGEEP
jgi:RNA polymerase sigma-70 factor (ECF subfamily)